MQIVPILQHFVSVFRAGCQLGLCLRTRIIARLCMPKRLPVQEVLMRRQQPIQDLPLGEQPIPHRVALPARRPLWLLRGASIVARIHSQALAGVGCVTWDLWQSMARARLVVIFLMRLPSVSPPSSIWVRRAIVLPLKAVALPPSTSASMVE